MQVQQLSIAFSPEQDRILVRVNTPDQRELQFWFTRRLTLGLMPLLDKLMVEYAARQVRPDTPQVAPPADGLANKAIADFRRSDTLRRADFATPYHTPDNSELLFGSPLLITEVTFGPAPGGHVRLACSEKLVDSAQARSFELALSDTLAHAFMHLLERAVVQSQWRGAGQVADADAAAPQGNSRPEFLN